MNEKIPVIIQNWAKGDVTRRLELIREIVKTGSQEGLRVLLQIVNRDKDIQIRQSARKAYNALYRYCYPQSQESSSSCGTKVDESLLFAWLQSRDPEQEMKALLHCQSYTFPKVMDWLRKNYTNFHDDKVKATLVKTIALQRKASDVVLCYPFLEDPSPRVRANAIEALEIINHPNTYTIFVQWLSDSDNRVKANCIKALRKLGQQSVNKILEDMLGSEYPAYKESALYVISLNPTRQGLYLIQSFLSQETELSLVERALYIIHEFARAGVKGAQAYLDEYYAGWQKHEVAQEEYLSFEPSDLESLDADIVLRALSRILENQYCEYGAAIVGVLQRFSQDFRVSSFAIRVLGELQLQDYVSFVIPWLKSEDDRVRANAVEAVGRMQRGIDCLIPCLEDHNNRVRANAIVALAHSGITDVSAHVLQMARSQDSLFRKSALYAIKQIRLESVLPALCELIQDSEVSIRNQALEVLQFYEICGVNGATEVLQQQGQSLYC